VFLAKHHGRRLRSEIELTFAPKEGGAPPGGSGSSRTSVTVRFG
jgi:hypothetical protein